MKYFPIKLCLFVLRKCDFILVQFTFVLKILKCYSYTINSFFPLKKKFSEDCDFCSGKENLNFIAVNLRLLLWNILVRFCMETM